MCLRWVFILVVFLVLIRSVVWPSLFLLFVVAVLCVDKIDPGAEEWSSVGDVLSPRTRTSRCGVQLADCDVQSLREVRDVCTDPRAGGTPSILQSCKDRLILSTNHIRSWVC